MTSSDSTGRGLSRGKRAVLGIIGVLVVFLAAGPPDLGASLLFTAWHSELDGGAHKLHELMRGVNDSILTVAGLILIFKPAWAMGVVQNFLAAGSGFLLAGVLSLYVFPPVIIFPVVTLVTMGVVLWTFRGGLPWQQPADLRPVASRSQLALTALIAVPLVFFALDHASLQRSTDTLHGALGHWAGGTATAIMIVLMFGFAALRMPGWRLPAWSGGVALFMLGLGSAWMPEQASALGTGWAITAIVAAAGFVALAEYEGRSVAVSVTASPVRTAGS